MTAHYEDFGVSFLYPENWKIVDEQRDQWPRSVSVQSPNGGFWELQVYPSRIEAEQLSGEVVNAMRQVYDDMELHPVTEQLWGVSASGFDLHFFCLDFLVTSRIRSFQREGRTYLLICQAESREFDRQALVFDAITKSMLSPRQDETSV